MSETHEIAVDANECRCACHTNGSSVKHTAPCCNKCPYCNRNIKILSFEQHAQQCRKRHHNP